MFIVVTQPADDLPGGGFDCFDNIGKACARFDFLQLSGGGSEGVHNSITAAVLIRNGGFQLC